MPQSLMHHSFLTVSPILSLLLLTGSAPYALGKARPLLFSSNVVFSSPESKTAVSAKRPSRRPLNRHREESIQNPPAAAAGEAAAETSVQCLGRDDTKALSAASASAGGRRVVISKGQTCAAGDVTIASLRIEKGGMLKPLPSQTITLSNDFEAGTYQVFTNALDGQGTVSFPDSPARGSINPLWWAANTQPGATDMTKAVQAAINATGGRGKVTLPSGSYLITDTLTLPKFYDAGGGFSMSPLVIEGDGPFLTNLINKATAGKPTLLINRDLVIVRNLGFWGNSNLPNDGIRVMLAGRIHIQSCKFLVQGNAIFLEKAQSIWIQDNFGTVSSGSGLAPAGVTRLSSFGPTDSFVYVNIPDGGFANHIVIEDNMNEFYSYQVYTAQSGSGYGFSWAISGNQFEGSTNGLRLVNIQGYDIHGNYMGEAGSGYTLDLDSCRYGTVGPNYVHLVGLDSKVSTLKLNNVYGTTLLGMIHRLYLTGTSIGLVAQSALIDRVQDETTDHQMSMVNCVIGSVAVPLNVLNSQVGRAIWYADDPAFTAYPTVRLGDQVLRVNPTSGPGWIATKASSTGPLAQIAGRGPDPVVLNDYAAPAAYDFRITVVAGGVTGTATYKVEWRNPGLGAYADLTNVTVTTELAHLVQRDTKSGPAVTFAIRWPPGVTYVAGDKWALNSVVAPTWAPIH